LSEEFVNDLGTTEMILRTVRAATATSVEVTSPVLTTLNCLMTARTVQIDIVGGAPGNDGTDGRDGIDGVGAVDPGDLTLYFENGLT
jgi:hypothetical protein